jgi:aspartate dehydrogenase
MRIACLGVGSIAASLQSQFAGTGIELVAALARRPPPPGFAAIAVADLDALCATQPDLVVECAGHEAVGAYVPALLTRGLDVIVASTGALADPTLETQLRGRPGRLLIPTGALAGIDALAAATHDAVARVELTSTKPPSGWGLPEEAHRVLFEGSAREAARAWPKNANVAATVALAGIGFDATRVRLVADPAVMGNQHRLEVEGAFGCFASEITGRPQPDNPRTSRLTALSILHAIANRSSILVL